MWQQIVMKARHMAWTTCLLAYNVRVKHGLVLNHTLTMLSIMCIGPMSIVKEELCCLWLVKNARPHNLSALLRHLFISRVI